MQISFLIATKNRPKELRLTLNKLKTLLDFSIHEVLVFIDGCKQTELLISEFNWVKWCISKTSISASPARAILYKKAKGNIFIGLDDDAIPLSEDFIVSIEAEFSKDTSIGVLSFQEVRGIFESDVLAKQEIIKRQPYFTSDFVGCGFAISNVAYSSIKGFPEFIDIYGEEPCVALQILDAGFNIKYVPEIVVNHRIDIEKRKQQGKNYFRFEKQLKNSIRFYTVYYPKPVIPVLRLLIHNFKKYAISDKHYFKLFFKVIFNEIISLESILKHRSPVKVKTLIAKKKLKGLIY